MLAAFDMAPRLDAVGPAVRALREAAGNVLATEALAGFEVAVAEALTNIVVHGYRGVSAPKEVEIALVEDGAALVLTILDHAPPPPPDLYDRSADLEDIDIMAESGRGLALIRHFASTVSFAPSDTGNRLTLRFRSQPTGRAAPLSDL